MAKQTCGLPTILGPDLGCLCSMPQGHLAVEAALILLLLGLLAQRTYKPGSPALDRLTEKVGVASGFGSRFASNPLRKGPDEHHTHLRVESGPPALVCVCVKQ